MICRRIKPTENIVVAILAHGEGFHNYHHVFPWDYKNGELGSYGTNHAAAFIDLFAKIGWAYNVRSVSPEMIQKRAMRSGDGSRHVAAGGSILSSSDDQIIWGWNDENMSQTDKMDCNIVNKVI